MTEFCPHCGKEIKANELKLMSEPNFKFWANSARNNVAVYLGLNFENTCAANPNPVFFDFKLNQ